MVSKVLTHSRFSLELIQLAKHIRAARVRGEETRLTDEEIAVSGSPRKIANRLRSPGTVGAS
jgi:hypothetical protein